MKYIKEEVFTSLKGEPVKFQTVEPSGKVSEVEQVKIGQVFLACLRVYQPDPQQGRMLSIAELREFNKAFDILEDPSGPQEKGFWRFEDRTFDLLKKVVLWYIVFLSPRNAPKVEDLLNSPQESV